jgi:hypothetical protein
MIFSAPLVDIIAYPLFAFPAIDFLKARRFGSILPADFDKMKKVIAQFLHGSARQSHTHSKQPGKEPL